VVARGILYPNVSIQALDLEGGTAELQWSATQKILDQIVRFCREDSIPIAFVYNSANIQYDPAAHQPGRIAGSRMRPEWLTGQVEVERRLSQWATKTGVPFLSLTETFREEARKSPGKFNYALDSHWNAAGHRLAASAISKWLQEQQLIRPASP
jgi:hypothetical protein